MAELNVFSGPNAIRDFLNPDLNSPLPLVELPGRLNPFRDEGVRIFAKLMYLLPLLNVKSLPALNMLLEAEKSGRLKDAHTLVENSSGNTAFSLAILARIFGIQRVKAIVPRDIAPGKLELLRLSGADLKFSSELPGEPSGIVKAREAGKEDGFFNPGQYGNEANPAACEKWVAPQIWEQTRGKLTVFCAGLGTTGTVVGASRYFLKRSAKVTVLGVLCTPDNAVPGVRTESRLREIAFDWRSAANYIVEAGTKESFKKSLDLCQVGLMAGPSSGFALAGLLRFLEARRHASALDEFRNRDGEVLAVLICADTPLPYLDKYSTHLDPCDF